MLPLLVFTGALVCLGNLLGLGLFVLAYRRQVARQAERLDQTRDDFQAAINQLLDRQQALQGEALDEELSGEEEFDEQRESSPRPVREAAQPHHAFEPVLATTPATIHLQGGMNLTKRVQILRLHRRGENSSRIATSLGVPRAEVDLVVKLSGMHAAQ